MWRKWMSKKELDKKAVKEHMIAKIREIELENLESADAEKQDTRGKIVDKILAELEKAVSGNEN
jgi:VIT1/CCC1 family predicted Fe2+/Mn2+ transporter